MTMEVKFISKELIKPSSPTPNHLRHYQLSFLDQIESPVFLPAILFYQKPHINNFEICNILKNSLRQALTIFYPVAGRIKNNSYVDCNDEGFLFVEARADCQLSDILRYKNPRNNKNFIPVKLDEASDLGGFFQITFFNCGGLVISFAISHKVCDGLSQLIFGKIWAAIARGETIKYAPSFGANLFPPTNESVYEPARGVILKEKIVTRMFVFSASTLEVLKAKYSVNGVSPSRAVALAAFIWSRFMATTQAEAAKNNNMYSVIHGVDLRSRMEPALPNLSFGNLVWLAIADADIEAIDDDYGIAKRMQDSIRNINADLVRKLQNSDEHFNLLKKFADTLLCGKKEEFLFSSLCNFPIYESIDFGWGKALWIGLVPDVCKNLAFFLDTKEGKGVEAWISLKEEDMDKFESDKELLAHVSSSSPNDIALHA